VKAEVIIISMALITACMPAEENPPMAPEPIGPELLSFTAQTDFLACGEAHLYRAQRLVQFQCFSTTLDAFSWENRGTLSDEGAAALDAALASADFDNTEPAPDDGLCKGNPDAHSASRTLWVGDRSFTYSPSCPTVGVAELDEVADTLIGDISECMEPGTELDLLDSVEPGCRAY
jgi:hypothetical protein